VYEILTFSNPLPFYNWTLTNPLRRSEVLDYTGYLGLPELSSETEEALEKVKIAAKRFVNQWRIQVRHYLNPDNIKAYIKKALETDSMTTMGLALGAFLGFLLG